MKLIGHDYWRDHEYGGFPEHFNLLVDPEAAEFLIEVFQKRCSQTIDSLAAKNNGKSIIEVEDMDDIKKIIDIRESMKECNRVRARLRGIKKKASEDAL